MRVLPIQIEHRWQDIGPSTPPLPCADYLAVTKARKIKHRVGIVRRGSTSRQSRHGLDWMNFFLADVQTPFGTFVAVYLADLDWSKGPVGRGQNDASGPTPHRGCGPLSDL